MSGTNDARAETEAQEEHEQLARNAGRGYFVKTAWFEVGGPDSEQTLELVMTFLTMDAEAKMKVLEKDAVCTVRKHAAEANLVESKIRLEQARQESYQLVQLSRLRNPAPLDSTTPNAGDGTGGV